MPGNQTSSDGLTILVSNKWKITIAALYGMVFLVGTMGNLLVIYIFGWRKRTNRKTSELLLLSLGICDLTTSILIPPLMIIMTLSAGKYIWLLLGCQVIPFFLSTCITVTQILLIIICFDRYRAIVTPLKRSVCWRLITTGVVIGCILGIVLDVPMLLQANKAQLDRGECFDYKSRPELMIGQSSAFIARDMLSFGTMAYFIRKMLIALKKSASFRKNLQTRNSVKDGEEFSRTRKLLFVVLVVFAICIWPADITLLAVFIYYKGSEYSDNKTERIFTVVSASMTLQAVNSSVNVFIYSAIHPDFKRVLRRMKDAVSCTNKRARARDEYSSNNTMDLSVTQGRT